MVPFLRQAARHYCAAGDIDRRCFLFPNRRSMAFFRKYVASEVAAGRDPKPIRMPSLLTINDFFYKIYGTPATDKVNLMIELYHCYQALYPQAESLDDFIFWGDIILSDFDDADKYLVDAGQLFANVADFKSIQDNYSYLTENQKSAILSFLGHFQDGQGHLTVDIGASRPDMKARFLQIWNLLHPLYRDFRRRLADLGMAYEGMVYRSLAEKLRAESVTDIVSGAFPGTEKYVFVGLNALNECEKTVLRRMQEAGVAEFCWDYSGEMIRNPLNKSSFFMNGNVQTFPQAFKLDEEGLQIPEIHVISVPSSTGQTRLIPQLLGSLEGVGKEPDTAIVIPDESLLMPLLNAVPEEVEDINVTMGYPMKAGGVYSLMSSIASMQLHLRKIGEEWLFYHKYVHAIFSNGLFRKALTDEEQAAVKKVKGEAQYYVDPKELEAGPVLRLVFTPVVTEPETVSPEAVHRLAEYLQTVLSSVASRIDTDGDMLLELDLAKRYYTTVNILKSKDLSVLPGTFLRLLDQLLAGISVPYKGEPLKGLQIMGPLETRALDFSHLFILSANEGIFPRRSVSSSFIPPELRKGFGLPTYEYQDAVWAYYFYRMIQRAEKVWLLYDSRTEGLKSGEESRYIKQLEYHFGVKLKRYVAAAPVKPVRTETEIPKTEEDIRAVRRKPLSASTLQSYLYCPAKFYYRTVKELEEEDEVAESLDAGRLGNVFHETMHELYDQKEVTREYLEGLQKDRAGVRKRVEAHIREEMRSVEVAGRNLVISEVIQEYVRKTLERDRELMEAYGTDRFRIIGLEKRMEMEFEGFRFIGFIDRMDSFREGEVRVVDYKTGKVEDQDIDITDENAEAVAAKLFGESNAGRPKIALQLFLYDTFVQNEPALRQCRIVNSIYSAARLFTVPVENVPQSRKFSELVSGRLKETLAEIIDPAVPFRRTGDAHTCSFCDFKNICGR